MFKYLVPASKTLIDHFARLDIQYFVPTRHWITNSVGKRRPTITGST